MTEPDLPRPGKPSMNLLHAESRGFFEGLRHLFHESTGIQRRGETFGGFLRRTTVAKAKIVGGWLVISILIGIGVGLCSYFGWPAVLILGAVTLALSTVVLIQSLR